MTVFTKAHEQEQSGHLREARDLLVTCAKAVCGSALHRQCVTRYTRLDSEDIPSVVPVVIDETGARRTDVQVKMDGELLTSRLDGQPLSVDPGLHEFVFSTPSGAASTEKILVVQGQRNRILSVSLGALDRAATQAAPAPPPEQASVAPAEATKPESPPEQPPQVRESHDEGGAIEDRQTRRHSPVPFVIGVLGASALVGAGAGTLLWSTWGKKDGMFLAADVALGVSIGAGVTALGVATWLFVTARSDEATPPRSAYRLGVQPTRTGAVASVTGAF